ncbi:hypothetical protein GCM10022217_35160 [Chryseobacterium ginsenosidimutans]|uniref:hypothetical protein n=1 Tax=Chryseobacterium ginsenosidimutans TaxID=687846 RepID=UPI0031D82312
MIKTFYFIVIFAFGLCFLSCKKGEKNEIDFEKFSVDKGLPQNDTIKLLSKHPELKLFKDEKIESKTRTAYIIETTNLFQVDNYKCKAASKNDTLEILLNNNNGFFGNGVLLKVFEDRFLIKDIDPKTLHGEIKFIKTRPVYQKLALNKSNFQKKDSIYGFIDYATKVDSFTKIFRGYFKAIIK